MRLRDEQKALLLRVMSDRQDRLIERNREGHKRPKHAKYLEDAEIDRLEELRHAIETEPAFDDPLVPAMVRWYGNVEVTSENSARLGFGDPGSTNVRRSKTVPEQETS